MYVYMYTKHTLPEKAHLHVVRMIQSPLMDEKFVSNIQVHVKDDGSTTYGNGIDVAKYKIFWCMNMNYDV